MENLNSGSVGVPKSSTMECRTEGSPSAGKTNRRRGSIHLCVQAFAQQTNKDYTLPRFPSGGDECVLNQGIDMDHDSADRRILYEFDHDARPAGRLN